jgi:hypothetical protein
MDAIARKTVRRPPTPPTKRAEDRKAHGRSRITNHADLLPGVKGNAKAARRFRDLVNALIADSGSLDMCSEIRIGLIRRLAAVTVQSEMLEADLINGKQIDTTTLCQLASTALRLSTKLGLERIARPVPGLHDVGGLLDRIARDSPIVEQSIEHEGGDDG